MTLWRMFEPAIGAEVHESIQAHQQVVGLLCVRVASLRPSRLVFAASACQALVDRATDAVAFLARTAA